MQLRSPNKYQVLPQKGSNSKDPKRRKNTPKSQILQESLFKSSLGPNRNPQHLVLQNKPQLLPQAIIPPNNLSLVRNRFLIPANHYNNWWITWPFEWNGFYKAKWTDYVSLFYF